jgi:tRNA pseudouridine55 synthase
MKKVVCLDKPLGLTPLEAVEKFKRKNKKYKDVKIGYAGRLDPMASGVLLLLIGDENKKINDYMKLDKEYQAEILFGYKTDSYDLLGLAEYNGNKSDWELVKTKLRRLKGIYDQTIPIYSSYTIKRKPLFWYARHGKKVRLPKRQIEIKDIEVKSISTISNKNLLKEIKNKISKVKGDFRQEKILNQWKKLLKKDRGYDIIKLKIRCSSGTYIRAIANELEGCLFNLRRIKVGEYGILSCQRA